MEDLMRLAFTGSMAVAALAALALVTPAHAGVDCLIGLKTGNPHCSGAVIAPVPDLGTGLSGVLILAGGLALAFHRRRQPQTPMDAGSTGDEPNHEAPPLHATTAA